MAQVSGRTGGWNRLASGPKFSKLAGPHVALSWGSKVANLMPPGRRGVKGREREREREGEEERQSERTIDRKREGDR